MAALGAAVKAAGLTVIRRSGSHQFPGGGRGVTGFFLLAQSHAAFHSYPEHGYLALDVYSCAGHDPKPIAGAMRELLRPGRVVSVLHRRGGGRA